MERNKKDIEEILSTLPSSPGVYIMKDTSGSILYIGKAANLRSRVRSYFRARGDGRYAVRFLATKTADIDCIVTTNEKEALLLEDTLLKKYKPRYNIRLKDSKTYVSIKITVAEKFPRILVTRQIKKDGSKYFGPYVSARGTRETVKLLRKIFPLRVCSPSEFRNRTRPCLDYQLGLCSAPAVGYISEEDYRELVNGAIMFLEGRNTELLRKLKKQMDEAARRLDFEEAARLRDRITAIEEMLERQTVVSHRPVDRDVIGLARLGGEVAIQVLFIREGRLVNSAGYTFLDRGLPDPAVLSSFITQFYRGYRYIPPEILVPATVEDQTLIVDHLAERAGRKVKLTVPRRGDRLELLKMAIENALETMRRRKKPGAEGVVEELVRRLRLGRTPRVIEAFDISNLGGKMAVGAMVAFRDGEPDRNSWRLFRIRGVEGQDDYAMMREVMERRYGKGGAVPDLILVDGGKGQLAVALRVLEELGLRENVEVVALAKERPAGPEGRARGERVFLPGVKDAIPLREGSKPDLLLRRIRDEVHRFAVTYQRRLRKKEAVSSPLDTIPGIGEKRKKALYERFGDLRSMTEAPVEALMQVPGIGRKEAEAIKELKTVNREG